MEESRNRFTVENIERTLHQFYNDAHSQAEANQYLMLAQVSPEAWNFAWDLLHPIKPSEAQFFGASTLQVKISRYWQELPRDQYEALRDKLLQALFSYITGPKVILTRLCIAMASFVIQTITDFWPSAINDLISAFQTSNIPNASPQQVALVLIELLTVLYEEFQTARMAQSRNSIVRNSLRSSYEMVMNLVESILSKTSAPVELCEISLKCYSSWAQIGSIAMENNTLLLLAFDLVYRDDVSQTALECLSNIANHPDASKYPSVVLKMVENITKFDSLLQKAIQDDDMDKCGSIYALVIAVAENHCDLLLDVVLNEPEMKDMILKIVRFILQCSGTPGQYPIDEICSEQAFGFWYTLQDSIVSSEPPKYEQLLLTFHPIFQSLLDTYLVKLQYPAEHVYKQWKSDEQESFRCYRQDIGDSLMYCYNILRQAALANLMAHLTIATTTALNNPQQWQYLEACLFAFKEVAESVNIKEHIYISQFISHLRNIPLQNFNLYIISATMEAIGAYAEWINRHPNVLDCIIPLLLMGIQNTEVAPSATFALKDITRNINSGLCPFAEQILCTSQEALKGNVLQSREKVRLMYSIGRVLSIMPYSYIMSYLNPLLLPILNQLQQELCSHQTNPNSGANIVLNLHMLSMLFATLDICWESDQEDDTPKARKIKEEDSQELQPILIVLEKLLSILTQMGDKWDVNEQITEALCDALKRAISTLSIQSKILLPEIINLLLHLYKRCPHSSVLNITKQLLILFASDEEQRPRLCAFFATLCNHTIQLSLKDFRESTTIIESFLELLENTIKKAFIIFKNEDINLLVLFQFGLAALNLPEKPTVKAAAGFLTEFITHSREVPNMLNIVFNQGEILVMQVMKVIGGDSPRSVVEHMPDILMALNKKYFDNLCRWLVPFVQQEGFPSNRVSHQEKEEFTKLILKERSNKRKMKETVIQFSLLCRGLIGTEYAAQTSHSLP